VYNLKLQDKEFFSLSNLPLSKHQSLINNTTSKVHCHLTSISLNTGLEIREDVPSI
jgi:hypothetical protein